jgi:hypothetical protein
VAIGGRVNLSHSSGRKAIPRVVYSHTPPSADNSSARTRQIAQQRLEIAYAYGPIMLAHDRRVLDIPSEERLQSRICGIVAWAKTMLPVIHQNIRDARAKLHTSHHNVRTSLTRQRPKQPLRTRRPPPLQHRPLAQSVPSLAYSTCANDFSMRELNSLRFQPTFVGSSLGAAVAAMGLLDLARQIISSADVIIQNIALWIQSSSSLYVHSPFRGTLSTCSKREKSRNI